MNLRILLAMVLFGVTAMAEDVSAYLEPIRERHGLPALAAAVVLDGEIVAIGATGLRHLGGNGGNGNGRKQDEKAPPCPLSRWNHA